jgi:DNA-binding XRE family transcriptional regulator
MRIVKSNDPVLVGWGQQIRIRREALNAEGQLKTPTEPCMTQEQLGALLDPQVGQSTVARWENGDMEPRRIYKAQLATILHTKAEFLFPLVAV